MTQKFPFDHFLKLDGLGDVQVTLKKAEMPVSPVIIEQTLKGIAIPQPKLASEFSPEELKTITVDSEVI